MSERPLEAALTADPPRFPPAPVPPILRGASVNVIGGSPFCGKTPLMALLVRQFLAGTVLGYPAPPSHVSEHCYLGAAGSWQDEKSQWFAGLPVRGYALRDDLAFSPSQLRRRGERLQVLAWALDRLAPLPQAVVWIDPLTAFYEGSILDPDVCYRCSHELHRVALQRQITIVGTAVSSKQKPDPKERYTHLLSRIAGSASFYSTLDTCLYLATPDECALTTYSLGVYPRLAEEQVISLIRDKKTGHFEPTIDMGRETALYEAIPYEPAEVTSGELEARFCQGADPVSRSTLYRWLRELVSRGVIQAVRRGVFQRRKPS